jgi:predicted esterase YcpF (UPF0227 family)
MKKINTMNHILVIHGFNSGPGDKSESLEKHFPNFTITTPQLNNEPLSDIKILQDFIDKHRDVHIVGTSLGGFYGQYLAYKNQRRNDLSFYLINPSYRPYDSFQTKLGEEAKNYKTNEKFIISEHFVKCLEQLQRERDVLFDDVLYHTYYFFGRKDEILNHNDLIDKLFSFFKPVNILIDNQDHRHDNLDVVIKQIKLNQML